MAAQIKKEEMLAKFRDLPEDLQNAIFSPDTADAILAAGKKYGVSIDKIGELGDETGLVMLGVTPPNEFIRNLSRRMEIDPEKAKAIAEEINQKIFQPVRESLKKVHGLGQEKPATPPPTPSLPRGGAMDLKSPPLQGGVGEVKKPLPTREEIKMPPPPAPKPPEKIIPPELKTPELPSGSSKPGFETAKKPDFVPPGGADIQTKVKAIFDEIEQKKSKKYAANLPPIFAKNIPPAKDDLEADLEKKLSEAKPAQTNYQKKSDPYREPIEP